MYKLIIFDIDGTLFDSLEAISTSVKLTFDELLPTHKLNEAHLNRLIRVGAPPEITFRALQPESNLDSFDEKTWVTKYRSLYAVHGQPLTTPYPRAKELLTALKGRGIPLAVISNKAIVSVRTALKKHGLDGFFPEELVIGDGMFGEDGVEARRKPDPFWYNEVLVPRLKKIYGDDFLEKEGEVLMVGDTVTDIAFARNIRCKVVWCRYGQGDLEECEKLKPDFTIDELWGVGAVVFGELN